MKETEEMGRGGRWGERGRAKERDECGKNSKREPLGGQEMSLSFLITLLEDIGQVVQVSRAFSNSKTGLEYES